MSQAKNAAKVAAKTGRASRSLSTGLNLKFMGAA